MPLSHYQKVNWNDIPLQCQNNILLPTDIIKRDINFDVCHNYFNVNSQDLLVHQEMFSYLKISYSVVHQFLLARAVFSYGARPRVVYVTSVCRVRWIQVLHLKWNIFEALLWMMSCRMTSFFSFKSLLKFSSDFCREKGQNMAMALILNERWVDNIALKYVLHTNLDDNKCQFYIF